ncbi:MAG TPA: ParB N-terminal domain-containing protein [Thermoplasmata archaeon]|nr:ParB N-terminal domain-containing protein [Thermoplasmata archaeon]
MTRAPVFALVPLERLRGHEEHESGKVDELVAELRRTGEFREPIWVARDTWVILNGHHRVEASRRLGLKFVPAWVFDYHGDHVELDRWRPGPPIDKEEVVRRAHRGRPFPPKTTRHRLRVELPARTVPLEQLTD